MKWCGKSAPATVVTPWLGKPHPEQDQIEGLSHFLPPWEKVGAGWLVRRPWVRSLEAYGNVCPRGMIITASTVRRHRTRLMGCFALFWPWPYCYPTAFLPDDLAEVRDSQSILTLQDPRKIFTGEQCLKSKADTGQTEDIFLLDSMMVSIYSLHRWDEVGQDGRTRWHSGITQGATG